MMQESPLAGCSGCNPSTCGQKTKEVQKMRGTVKWFNATKGYGFIAPDGAEKDVFVHISEVQKAGLPTLNQGDIVEFDMSMGKNGREAAVALKKA
jgi:CspA family cold shock protein